MGKRGDHGGQTEVLQAHSVRWDQSQGGGVATALAEDVYPEPARHCVRVRKIELALLDESIPLLLRQDRLDQVCNDPLFADGVGDACDWLQGTFNPNEWGVIRGQMDVRGKR